MTFDRPVDPNTIDANSFRAFARHSGSVAGSYSFSNGNTTVTLTPATALAHGEIVLANLANTVLGADAVPLRTAGYAFQFRTRSRATGLFWTLVGTQTVVDSEARPILYGAMATDLDEDGWVDLGAINEGTTDLRVLLNSADGSGWFDDFLVPTTPLGSGPSPNEQADFDNDGHVDAVVANAGGGSISVLLGNGDGTFGPQQTLSTGALPRGLAVLDVDGDADWDVAVSHQSSNNVALARNDGTGVFGTLSLFEGGGHGEYAISSADMNNDGIYDLVVGLLSDSNVVVHLGNGDGTFTAAAPQPVGGNPWMIQLGDVNGDGIMDVSSANGMSSSGSILLGNGDGTFGAPMTIAMGGLTIATDLGDLDGDGDLDWVLSSYGAQVWRVFANDGNGGYSLAEEFTTTTTPSCAVIFDIDNDADVDLVLTDETSDEILIYQNQSAPVPSASLVSALALTLSLAAAAARRTRAG